MQIGSLVIKTRKTNLKIRENVKIQAEEKPLQVCKMPQAVLFFDTVMANVQRPKA